MSALRFRLSLSFVLGVCLTALFAQRAGATDIGLGCGTPICMEFVSFGGSPPLYTSWDISDAVNAPDPYSVQASSNVVGEVTGVKLTGSATFSFNPACTPADYNDYCQVWADFGSGGNGSGTFAAGYSLPVGWNFSITESGSGAGNGQEQLSLGFNLFTSESCIGPYGLSPHCAHSFVYNGSGFGNISGNGSIGGLGGLTLESWSMGLYIAWQPGAPDDTLTVSIPGNSIDLGPSADTTAVPEPASLVLLATGLGAAGRRVIRRRA